MSTRMVLMKRARRLRSQMRWLGPLLKGTVMERRMRCGKAGCRCTKGQPHVYLVITWKEEGRSRMVYVDERRREEALAWSANYRKFKELLGQHTEVLIRMLKREKKAEKKGARRG